jgi:hypothetical protein
MRRLPAEASAQAGSHADQNRQRTRKNNRLEPCFNGKKKRKIFNKIYAKI